MLDWIYLFLDLSLEAHGENIIVLEEFSAGCISFALVKEVLEKLGWTDTNIETNGWDIDYWVTFIKEGKNFDYIVSGSLYYGNINIRKEKF